QTHSHASTVTRSRQREAAVQQQTEQAVQEAERSAAAETRSISGLLGQGPEQSDNRSVTGLLGQRAVDNMVVAPLKRGTVRSAGGEIREDNTAEEAPAEPRAVTRSHVPEQVAAVTPPVKRTIRVRHKRHHKRHHNTLDVPLSGPVPKVKEEDEYYYENVVVTDKRTGSAKAPEENATFVEHRAPSEEIQVAQIPHAQAAEVQTTPVSEDEKAEGFIRQNGPDESDHTSPNEEAGPAPKTSSASKGSAAYD